MKLLVFQMEGIADKIISDLRAENEKELRQELRRLKINGKQVIKQINTEFERCQQYIDKRMEKLNGVVEIKVNMKPTWDYWTSEKIKENVENIIKAEKQLLYQHDPKYRFFPIPKRQEIMSKIKYYSVTAKSLKDLENMVKNSLLPPF